PRGYVFCDRPNVAEIPLVVTARRREELNEGLSRALCGTPSGSVALEPPVHVMREAGRRDRKSMLTRELLERELHLLGGREAIARLLLERPQHDPLERRRVVVTTLGRRRNGRARDILHRDDLRFRFEEVRPRRKLIEHHAQRKDVASPIERRALRLF